MMNRWFCSLMTLCGAGALWAAGAFADTVHVDVEWDGPSKGTAEQPFRTLGEAAKAYAAGNNHVVKVAGGRYRSTKAGGAEDFGSEGYNLNGRSGQWRGGYGGWTGEEFDWSEKTRVLPDVEAEKPEGMTVVDLEKANSRAFMLVAYSASTLFEGFVFQNAKVTQPDYDGGALLLKGGMGGSAVRNCVFLDNRTTRGGGGLSLSGRGGTSANCVFIGNHATLGGALEVAPGNGEQTVQDFVFRNNSASNAGGAVYVPSYTVFLNQCTFENNTAGEWGGAVGGGSAMAALSRCRLVGNKAQHGAAMGGAGHQAMQFRVENCLIVRNTSTADGAFIIEGVGGYNGGDLQMRFATLADNTAPGGAVRAERSGDRTANLAVVNSIIIGTGNGVGVRADDPNASISVSNVYGFNALYAGTAKPADGAISADPEFVNPEGEDYRVLASSACTDIAKDIGVTVDLEGHPRPRNKNDIGVDIGCHEVLPVPVDTVLLLK